MILLHLEYRNVPLYIEILKFEYENILVSIKYFAVYIKRNNRLNIKILLNVNKDIAFQLKKTIKFCFVKILRPE